MNYNDQFWVADNPADANSNDLFEQAKAYDLGIGVKQDKQRASCLYREAMNQGDKKAKHNLALLYIMQEGKATMSQRVSRCFRNWLMKEMRSLSIA